MTDEEFIAANKNLPSDLLMENRVLEEIQKHLDRGTFADETIELFKRSNSWYQSLSSPQESFVDGFLRGIRYMEGRKDD